MSNVVCRRNARHPARFTLAVVCATMCVLGPCSWVGGLTQGRPLAEHRSLRRTAMMAGSQKVMNTVEERQLLTGLGYSEVEAFLMKPELAKAVLERRTTRPWGDGPMPGTWTNGILQKSDAYKELVKKVERDQAAVAEEWKKTNQVNSKPGSKDTLSYF
mmetsp:Transcript_16555/g.45852  ORF Transcript_16555/g.45852 Transcript_16555/m.45852 type:complete len:159 (+) Transcript_16555:77-553(+)